MENCAPPVRGSAQRKARRNRDAHLFRAEYRLTCVVEAFRLYLGAPKESEKAKKSSKFEMKFVLLGRATRPGVFEGNPRNGRTERAARVPALGVLEVHRRFERVRLLRVRRLLRMRQI